jgi:integrase
MPISRVRDRQGRPRFEFEFSRRLGGRRLRTRKLLPASWTRTQADAFDRKESARLYAQATGVEGRRWTIDQAVARYLDERAHELKTGRAIGAELQSLQEYFVGRSLDELPDVCAEISDDYRGDVAPATLRNKLRYLCSAARWGWKKHAMSEQDPAGRVIFPAVRNERQVYVVRRQMVELARACVDRRARAAIRIAYYSGMRLGEIERAARVPGAFLLLDTKNGDPRLVPMHPKVRCCASIALGSRFQTGYHFRKARALVGLESLHFHDLRHSASAAMLAGGAELHTVGKVLGHRSAASMKRYGHLSIELLEAAVAGIGRATSSPSRFAEEGPKTASLPMEARAGVEPTYSDLQSGKRTRRAA